LGTVSEARSSHQTAHIFSVDVEEYFQVHAFEGTVDRSTWASMPSRIAVGVDLLLDLLAAHEAKGTFFILGWIAERHAHLVRRISEAGHEIASHGWWHRRVTELSREEFREEVRASKALLEDITGKIVWGYRAPSFSITPSVSFAFDVLVEEGYRYDSSIFPIWRPGYGWRGATPTPHWRHGLAGSLIEFPIATSLWGPFRIPAGGGGYLRQFPLSIVQSAFREHSLARIPGVFYIHPWELDPEQPRLRAGLLTRLRHYRGLHTTIGRLQRLLEDFSFTSVEHVLADGRMLAALETSRPAPSAASI